MATIIAAAVVQTLLQSAVSQKRICAAHSIPVITVMQLWHRGPSRSVVAAMVTTDRAPSHTVKKSRRPHNWRRVTALLALLMVSGCEALDRMDYLDQFFDAAAYRERHGGPAQGGSRLVQTAVPVDPEWEPARAPATPQRPASPIAPNAPPQRAPARSSEPPPASAPPAPDETVWVRNTVRQNQWLARDWAQLTSAQQLRVERRLRSDSVQLVAEHSEPAAIWDVMGLADRATLAFGDAPLYAGPTSAETRDASVSANRP